MTEGNPAMTTNDRKPWSDVHADYKSDATGVRRVLVFNEEVGTAVLVPWVGPKVRVETLVAIDWSDKGLSLEPVLSFIGDALVGVTTGTVDHPKLGTVPCHRVAFDADRVRDTEVHGRGYHAGFVVSLQ
jgi:hypothetical protein